MNEYYSLTYPADEAGFFVPSMSIKCPKTSGMLTFKDAFFFAKIYGERTVKAMNATLTYPKVCRRSMRILMNEIGVSPETAYAMMLMTAMLMDLRPEDKEVLETILEDCGVSPDVA